jgi:DNA polymerase-3 subunit alpha
MSKFQYSCGCSFNITSYRNEETKTDPVINFNPKIEEINLDCQNTWDLISDGNTKGCFQLESRLGRSIAKKLKPSNIEELSALISILRPGCLEAIRDGKSVTNHYIDKKNGEESIDYYHPSLEPILKSTYGEMIYQEQAMEIAKTIAGFDLQEADVLRKAIGKKKPEEMAKIKSKFIEGCTKENIVSEKEANEIFGWIEKSQRYSFNKSHAVSYAINAYLSAYCKTHFPKVFFASYLRFAKDKIDPKQEIKSLVQNASEMNIEVMPPDIRLLNQYFILHDRKIYFGLTDIKGFGHSVFDKLVNLTKTLNTPLSDLSWTQVLFKVLININSASAKSLIKSGALSYLLKTRSLMLFELEIALELTQKEIAMVDVINPKDLSTALTYLLNASKVNKKRKLAISNLYNMLKNPPYDLNDSPEWISDTEEEILGCSITCSKVDMYDVSMTNINCREFKTSNITNNIIVCGEIENISVTKTKTGKNPGLEMAFVTISDGFGSIDSIIFFPEQYRQYRNLLFDNNVVVICGNRSKNKDSLIVEKAYIAKT